MWVSLRVVCELLDLRGVGCCAMVRRVFSCGGCRVHEPIVGLPATGCRGCGRGFARKGSSAEPVLLREVRQ